MASVYSDREREERYSKLRRKKKAMDKFFDWSMYAVIAGALLIVIPSIYMGVLSSLFLGKMLEFFASILAMFAAAAGIYAVYRKDPRITALIAVLQLIFCVAASEGLADLLMLVVMILEVCVQASWQKLTQEEGFPDFDITLNEYAAREKDYARQAEIRAVTAGLRTDAELPRSNAMDDLLSDRVQAAPQHLHTYHDRSTRSAVPEVQPLPAASALMGTLEEIGAPPARVNLRKETDSHS